MLPRLAAPVFAAALVMMPPVRVGLEHEGFAASLTGMPSVAGTTPGSGKNLLRQQPISAAETTVSSAVADRAASEPTPTFGFGAHTPFSPSDSPRELILSFDDGPDLKFTPLVLDELDRRGLKAIFFVTGHRVIGDHPEDLARRELLGRIAAHGHMVANHTMTHRNLCQTAADEAAAEIDQNTEVIAQATGVRPLLFRAPYGARCRSLEAALSARQLVSVGWNLDPQDWRDPTSEGILADLQARLSRLRGRGILLLHDTHPASVYALGPLLDWIAQENRRVVRGGGTPIVFRDYSVFLPPRTLPASGIVNVAQSLVKRVASGVLPHLGPGSPIASLP